MELDSRKNEAKNDLKRQAIQHEVCRPPLLSRVSSYLLVFVTGIAQ